MALSARITRNRASLQIILPAELKDRYGLRPGGLVVIEPQHDGMLLRPAITPPSVSYSVSTIGYEGKTIEQFLAELSSAGIRQVIDVRELPLSRKNGFSKGALARHLREAHILYRHIPELGSPRGLRHVYKNGGSSEKFMEGYSSHLDKNRDSFEMMRGLALGLQSAILCFEKDYRDCHRRVLAERLASEGFRLNHL